MKKAVLQRETARGKYRFRARATIIAVLCGRFKDPILAILTAENHGDASADRSKSSRK
jgi:hypothetical protein